MILPFWGAGPLPFTPLFWGPDHFWDQELQQGETNRTAQQLQHREPRLYAQFQACAAGAMGTDLPPDGVRGQLYPRFRSTGCFMMPSAACPCWSQSLH